jgi:hypothetical protein
MYIEYVHCVLSKVYTPMYTCIRADLFEHRMHRVMSKRITNWVFTVYIFL